MHPRSADNKQPQGFCTTGSGADLPFDNWLA